MTCHVVFTHVGAQCIFKHLQSECVTLEDSESCLSHSFLLFRLGRLVMQTLLTALNMTGPQQKTLQCSCGIWNQNGKRIRREKNCSFFYYHFIAKLWKGFRNYKASLFRGTKSKWTIESVVGSQSQFPFRLQRVYSGNISRPINDLMYSETERTYWRKKSVCPPKKTHWMVVASFPK